MRQESLQLKIRNDIDMDLDFLKKFKSKIESGRIIRNSDVLELKEEQLGNNKCKPHCIKQIMIKHLARTEN